MGAARPGVTRTGARGLESCEGSFLLNRACILLLSFCALPLAADAPVTDALRVNFGNNTLETDPARGQTALEAQVLTALYEGLVVYDPLSLRPQPGAARSWSFADDGLSLTFTLRSGLQYEDGTDRKSVV